VDGRIEVLFDGGIRTGGDIVKAIGLGAHACLSGRACLYGLAAKGYDGVLCALHLLEQELHDCMMLAGLDSATAIPPDVVTVQPPLGRQPAGRAASGSRP
jgi:L-lactate dehydrogenase (cytochrome)